MTRDCKSLGFGLRRFESYFQHHFCMNPPIYLTELLHLPPEKFSQLKLVFNNNWTYKSNEVAAEIKAGLNITDESPYFDLLNRYTHGQAELVKKSVTTHNPYGRKRYHNGNYVLSFIPLGHKSWLLINAFKVIDQEKCFVGADYSALPEVAGYLDRLVITWDNRATQNIIMRDPDTIKSLTVKTILDRPYYEVEEQFPGYDKVCVSGADLQYLLQLPSWQTALANQKAVYLITDRKTGKHYVGSASGEEMLLGRWQSYVKNGHGGNAELRQVVQNYGINYIRENFYYSILDTFKSTTNPDVILARETWWKQALWSKAPFGYNDN